MCSHACRKPGDLNTLVFGPLPLHRLLDTLVFIPDQHRTEPGTIVSAVTAWREPRHSRPLNAAVSRRKVEGGAADAEPAGDGRITMDPDVRLPDLVRAMLRLEEAESLDGAVHALERPVGALFGGGAGSVLRGEWLGHALHPMLTDLTIGSWTSATLLDVLGGSDAAGAARLLVGAGLVAAGPTAWSGWAEWSEAGEREKRVGLVHAVTNGVAIGAYAASWAARRRGRRGTGVCLGLAGAAVAGVGGYLGGHLAAARKVGSRHPAYDWR